MNLGQSSDSRLTSGVTPNGGAPIFIHSLFRSGSTWLFDRFRKSEAGLICYQEPFHEILEQLSTAPNEVLSVWQEEGSTLRHPILDKPYFYEFHEIKDQVAQKFKRCISYQSFFDASYCPSFDEYVSALIENSPGRSVLQCCRSFGRLAHLKRNYGGTHVHLWRNPWDQWWSYQVNGYFDSINLVILNAENVPLVMELVRQEIGFKKVSAQTFVDEFFSLKQLPMDAEKKYFLFYAMWLYSFLENSNYSDIDINIECLSFDPQYVADTELAFKRLGVTGINLSGCVSPVGRYGSVEKLFYEGVERRVLRLFAIAGYDVEVLAQVTTKKRSLFSRFESASAGSEREAVNRRIALRYIDQEARANERADESALRASAFEAMAATAQAKVAEHVDMISVLERSVQEQKYIASEFVQRASDFEAIVAAAKVETEEHLIEIHALKEIMADQKSTIANVVLELTEFKDKQNEIEHDLADNIRNFELAKTRVLQTERELARAHAEHYKYQIGSAKIEQDMRLQISDLNSQLTVFQTSTLWKATWPLRRLFTRMPVCRKYARRIAKAIWWIITFRFDRLLTAMRAGNNRIRSKQQFLDTSEQVLADTLKHERSTTPEREFRDAVEQQYFDAPGSAHPGPKELESSSDLPLRLPQVDWSNPVVLMIDSVYPRPDQDAGSIEAVNFIRVFQSLGYQILFVADAEFNSDVPSRHEISALGVHCITGTDFGSVDTFLRNIGQNLDVCFLSRVYSGGRHAETVKRYCTHAKIIFNTVDLHYLREEREARLLGSRLALNYSFATREREFALIRFTDATIVFSQKEAEILRDALPGAGVYTLPLVRECPGRINDFGQRQGIGFIGGFLHSPNVDAVNYFLDEVLPIVRQHLPEIEFKVMGADMPDELKIRTDPGFIPIGYVADLSVEFEKIRLTVAPLRYGAGVKGKVVSSMSYGVPCVASPIAAEGMTLIDGTSIAIADGPEQFAARIVQLYTSENSWNILSDGGLNFVLSNHSFARSRQICAEILSDLRAPVVTIADETLDQTRANVILGIE